MTDTPRFEMCGYCGRRMARVGKPCHDCDTGHFPPRRAMDHCVGCDRGVKHVHLSRVGER